MIDFFVAGKPERRIGRASKVNCINETIIKVAEVVKTFVFSVDESLDDFRYVFVVLCGRKS